MNDFLFYSDVDFGRKALNQNFVFCSGGWHKRTRPPDAMRVHSVVDFIDSTSRL